MNSWSDVVKANIARSEERFKQTNIFSMEYIQCLQKLLPSFQTYFDSVKPEPFFDDATTKNVLIKDAAFSGIIDIESICFGDRLFFVALTQMALLTMKTNLDYVDYIKQELNLNEMQKKVLNFYVLVFCVDFMSEKDIQFNKDDVPVVTKEEKKLLMEIFNQFDSYI